MIRTYASSSFAGKTACIRRVATSKPFRRSSAMACRTSRGISLRLNVVRSQFTGDGEMLMGLGALATVAVKRPHNFALVVIDNEHYGETGMQRSHTGAGVDLAGIALGCGFRWTATVRRAGELEEVVPILHTAEGPIVVVLKVSSDRDPLVLPPWDGALLKSRFRQALLKTSLG